MCNCSYKQIRVVNFVCNCSYKETRVLSIVCCCSCKETRGVNFVCHCRTQPEPIPEQPKKGYKPKPFTEIVRLQRPHITRQQPAQAPPDEKYVQQVLAEKAARRAAESVRPKSATTERTQSASKSWLFSVCVYE